MPALKDWADREMTEARAATYLNHAASSPLPHRSAQALRRYVADRERLFHLYQAGRQDYDASQLRSRLGDLLGAPAGAVAFVPSTTDGVSGVLRGIDWRPGDNVVVPEDDFPGVVYAALGLAGRGVEVRMVPVDGHVELGRIRAALDGRTRAVVMSHVHWQTGHRIDLPSLGRLCREVGALSVVDAIQSLGQLPVRPLEAGIDITVAGSYKWLMAVPGAAVICASQRALGEITPDRAGWTGVETPIQSAPRLAWRPDASRFQVGGPCDPALVALDASVGLLLDLGIETIAEHLRGLLDRLLAGLQAPLRVNSSLEPAERSGFLSITSGDSRRDDLLVERLASRGVIVARRGGGIRVAPHWYTAPEDIDRLLAETARILGEA